MTVIDLRRAKNDELGRFAMRGKMIDAFLRLAGVRIFQTLNTVSISFETRIAADEFVKLLKAALRGREVS